MGCRYRAVPKALGLPSSSHDLLASKHGQHIANTALKLAALIEGGEAQYGCGVASINERSNLLNHRGGRAERQPVLQILGADGSLTIVVFQECDRLFIRLLGVIVDV